MRRVPPSRQTWRFILAAAIGLIPIVTALVYELGLESVPAVAAGLTIGGAIVRVMAMDVTEQWLEKYLPLIAGEETHEPTDGTNTPPADPPLPGGGGDSGHR